MLAMSDASNLHDACYLGRLDLVQALLAAGADPNAPASPKARTWISCAGPNPKPLNCLAIARAMSDTHVAIACLLVARRAVVDDTVLQDHGVESVGSAADQAFRAVLEAARHRG
jgi:ankyrin repeat protein